MRLALLLLGLLPLARGFGLGGPPLAAGPAAQQQAVVRRGSAPSMVAEMIKDGASLFSGKATLGGELPECPTTLWDTEIDVDEWQAKYRAEESVVCPIEIVASAADNAAGAQYFVENRDELKATLAKHGTLHFKGFDLMKSVDGFRTFWESMALEPCLDPIHSSGLRKFLSKKDAVYEEVNKQSLSQHYIGLHNEATHKKTATTGAFVCFSPATVSGGEFFIADGEKIFRDLDPEILKMLIQRQARAPHGHHTRAQDPRTFPLSLPIP